MPDLPDISKFSNKTLLINISIIVKESDLVISLLIYIFFIESIVLELSLWIVKQLDNYNDEAANSIL